MFPLFQIFHSPLTFEPIPVHSHDCRMHTTNMFSENSKLQVKNIPFKYDSNLKICVSIWNIKCHWGRDMYDASSNSEGTLKRPSSQPHPTHIARSTMHNVWSWSTIYSARNPRTRYAYLNTSLLSGLRWWCWGSSVRISAIAFTGIFSINPMVACWSGNCPGGAHHTQRRYRNSSCNARVPLAVNWLLAAAIDC